MPAPVPVWVASLGCPKNRVDTERLLGSLGFPVKLVSDPRKSRLILINTCAFLETATRESLRTIFDAGAAIKGMRNRPLVAVAGCLPGRYGIEALQGDIPEVDVWLHTTEQAQWPMILRRALRKGQQYAQGRLFTGKSYAFIKIAEGCPRRCAYCAIPSIRGSLLSESSDSIFAESAAAIAHGVKELILVAQDTTAWGMDIGTPLGLPKLVSQLSSLEGLHWLRLLYLYPPLVTEPLLEQLASIGKPFIPYFDIPLQHVDPDILRAMRRPFRTAPIDLINLIRSYFPDAAIRTTLMTGFPGENEDHFNRMCEFIKISRLDHVGVFKFQAEENTPAFDYPLQVADDIKEYRYAKLMSIQQDISYDRLSHHLDHDLEILVDDDAFDIWPNLYKGHAWFQCPEVDGLTYVSGDNIEVGNICTGRIASVNDYDLSALAL